GDEPLLEHAGEPQVAIQLEQLLAGEAGRDRRRRGARGGGGGGGGGGARTHDESYSGRATWPEGPGESSSASGRTPGRRMWHGDAEAARVRDDLRALPTQGGAGAQADPGRLLGGGGSAGGRSGSGLQRRHDHRRTARRGGGARGIRREGGGLVGPAQRGPGLGACVE